MKIKQLLRDLRSFANAQRISARLLSALLVLLSLIGVASSFKSKAASEITDKRYRYTYFTDGDFRQDGLDKSLMFYEYLPNELSWDTLNSMVANFTADGVRCKYRIFGYKSGGGGTLVFDSGGGGTYGQAIDITGAGFDYYNILLSAFDDDGNQIAVGNIDSGYVIFSWGELVQLPTTPPELVDGVQSIEEGINGTVTVTRAPSSVTTVPTSTVDINADDAAEDIMTAAPSGFVLISHIFSWFITETPLQVQAAMYAFLALALIGFILEKGW